MVLPTIESFADLSFQVHSHRKSLLVKVNLPLAMIFHKNSLLLLGTHTTQKNLSDVKMLLLKKFFFNCCNLPGENALLVADS